MIKDLLPLSTSYDKSDKEWRPCDLLPTTTQQTHNNMESQNFFFSHTHNKMKKHLSIFLYQAQNLQSLLFLFAKDGICLGNRSSSHCIDKIHNYTVTYYS